NYKTGISNLFFNELTEAMKRGYLNKKDIENIKNRNEKFPLSIKVWQASKLLIFDAKGNILKGVSGSVGKAVGRVCIIQSPKEFYKMKKGDILVCHLTDPEWTPLFKLASAVVADTGAALSHAAIVAREYNIPAVLGVGFATTKFKDGDMIQVDGDTGIVRGL
ncbi:MAG: PEP-utilizing enzyme, partial [Lachnoanaerobaculum sp.]|nr:PEP-utilizing enzyme [Lachnoanaerobaculum sp.]